MTIQLERDVSLQALNTLALPCQVDEFVRVNSDTELSEALSVLPARDCLVLGEGSNIVLQSTSLRSCIQVALLGIEVLSEDAEAVCLRVAAGENWNALVNTTLARGFYGLENLALIPGAVGAAPIQNIGAYGVELSDFVVAVHIIDRADGASTRLSAKDCHFAYRDSIFKQELCDSVVVTAIELRLSKTPLLRLEYPALKQELGIQKSGTVSPAAVRDAVVAIRRRKLPDPGLLPNAGSFFKNPIVSRAQLTELLARYPEIVFFPTDDPDRLKLAAGWLLENAGWKGYRGDLVGVHQEQALVLVNHGGATGSELLSLAEEIKASVLERYAVRLEREPRCY